jgi:hypothetical protein
MLFGARCAARWCPWWGIELLDSSRFKGWKRVVELCEVKFGYIGGIIRISYLPQATKRSVLSISWWARRLKKT